MFRGMGLAFRFQGGGDFRLGEMPGECNAGAGLEAFLGPGPAWLWV